MFEKKSFFVVPVPNVALYSFNQSLAKEELNELRKAFKIMSKKRYIHKNSLNNGFYRQDLVDSFREDVIKSLKGLNFKHADNVFDIVTSHNMIGVMMVFRNNFYPEISKVLELNEIIGNIARYKKYLKKYLNVLSLMEKIKENGESFAKNKKIKKEYEIMKKDKDIKKNLNELKEWQDKLADAEKFYGVKVNI